MKPLVRITLLGAFFSALLGLLPLAAATGDGSSTEIVLNSAIVQVVHNTSPNTDVLNMSLNITSAGEGGCEAGGDDFIATGWSVSIFEGGCGQITGFAFSFTIPGYVAHHIGSATYGTFYGLKPPAGAVASKIVALATPANTCGTWNISFQATGQDLEYLTTNPIALLISDGDNSGPFCFDANAQIGNGLVKPRRGVHRTRR
jgi:hypothetical protein